MALHIIRRGLARLATSPGVATKRITLVAAGVLLASVWGVEVEAHAFGERYDLPVPLWLNLAGASAVVALSFVVAVFCLRSSSERDGGTHFDLLGRRWFRFLTCPLTVTSIQLGSVGIFILALIAGFVGVVDPVRNAAPTIMWVLGWVGISYACALFGNVWALVNPWTILFDWAEAGTRFLADAQGFRAIFVYPQRWGVLPGVGLLFAVMWFMLASDVAGEPVWIAIALTVYSIVTWTGMALFGRDIWLERSEAFSLLASVLARFSLTGVRVTDRAVCERAGCDVDNQGGCSDSIAAFRSAQPESRQLNLRPFGAGLVRAHPLPPTMTVLVVVVLSMASFEGLLDTPLWTDLMSGLGYEESEDGFYAPGMTGAAMIGFAGLMFVLFYTVCAMINRLGRKDGRARTWTTMEVAGLFVLSLMPIAIAYHIAHYLHWFTVSIQYLIPAASDPFAWGWDLFGTRDHTPSIGAVTIGTVWHTAVVAIVGAHVIAVTVAHRIALIVFGGPRAAALSQLPMAALMVAYTVSSLWIIAQPIVV